MKTTLEVIFLLEDGKSTTFELENPRTDLTKAEVVAVANNMIEKKALQIGGLNIAAVKNAFVRKVDEVSLA